MLPEVDKSVEENVAAAEQEEAQNRALVTNEVSEKALSPVQQLEKLGLADNLTLNYTSFPTITLKDSVFSMEGESIGEGFQFKFIEKFVSYLYRGDRGRDEDPVLAYSKDKQFVDGTTGEVTIQERLAEWKELYKIEPASVVPRQYYVLMGEMVGGKADGDLVQLSVPPTSQGPFDGFMATCVYKGKDPRMVICNVGRGNEIGSGIKAFRPWTFKVVKP